MGMTDWLENRAIEDAQSRGHAGIWGFFKYDAPSDVAKALATAAIAAGVLMAGVAAVLGSST